MEMRTGKTRTAIELIARRWNRIDRVVWFCPVSTKPTIRAQWLKHTDLSPAQVYCFDERTSERTVPDVPVLIVGIESMSSSARVVLTVAGLITKRTFVVLDESDFIKGHRSYRTERITVLSEPAKYRLILTGTPLSQGVQDLFAQMRFLSPEILGYRSFYSFAANHLEYSEKHRGLIVRAHNTGLLASKIAPYVYQVTRAECFTQPLKTYQSVWCDLTKEQRVAYQEAKDYYLEYLLSKVVDDTGMIDVTIIFRLFTALQQITCGFWNHPERGLQTYPHVRTDLLRSCVPSDQQVIIWTKYRRCVGDLVDALSASYGPAQVAQLHGDVAQKDRESELARFRNGARFLVATPSTGGRGIELNEASFVIYHTNDFKYSVRLQSEDRCHGPQQPHPVTYLDLGTHGTIDQRIQDALAKKENVVQAFRQKIGQIKDADRKTIRKQIKHLVGDL